MKLNNNSNVISKIFIGIPKNKKMVTIFKHQDLCGSFLKAPNTYS